MPTRLDHAPSPTTILCAGMFRSGSTWAYNVVKRALAATPPSTPLTAGYFEGDELVAEIRRDGSDRRVFKFHLGTPQILEAIRSGAVHAVVYSRRDPLTALASCVDQFCSRPPFQSYWTFDRAVAHVVDGIQLGRDLAGLDEVLEVDLHEDGESASLHRILAHIGATELDADVVRGIERDLAFEAMRQRSLDIASTDPAQLFRGINDPDTLMHGGHVDQGAERDWAQILTPAQVEQAREAFAACVSSAPR